MYLSCLEIDDDSFIFNNTSAAKFYSSTTESDFISTRTATKTSIILSRPTSPTILNQLPSFISNNHTNNFSTNFYINKNEKATNISDTLSLYNFAKLVETKNILTYQKEIFNETLKLERKSEKIIAVEANQPPNTIFTVKPHAEDCMNLKVNKKYYLNTYNIINYLAVLDYLFFLDVKKKHLLSNY